MGTYKVTDQGSYLGREAGETFDADLSTEQVRRAVERGAIEVVDHPVSVDQEPDEDGSENDEE